MARGAGKKKGEPFISALSDWWKMVLLTEMVEPQGGAWGAVWTTGLWEESFLDMFLFEMLRSAVRRGKGLGCRYQLGG